MGKEDGANSHMVLIAAAANVRAMNYEIKMKDKSKLKKLTGSIIQAIATTTAMTGERVTLEMSTVYAIFPKKIGK
jgi:ubiquitin-activating enzyme E1